MGKTILYSQEGEVQAVAAAEGMSILPPAWHGEEGGGDGDDTSRTALPPMGWPEKDGGTMGAAIIAGEALITPSCGTEITDTMVVLEDGKGIGIKVDSPQMIRHVK